MRFEFVMAVYIWIMVCGVWHHTVQ